MNLQDTIRRILQEEVAEYARTLKNARKQGSGLRFPKSAIKANPNRFRPYSREQVDEENTNDKKITCKCGWSWKLKDGGNDPYTCHKCGHNNSKKYIKEEKEELLNESIKEKLTNLLDKKGLAETLNILKIDIDKLSSMMGISMEELMQKHNPFKNIFSDKEFEEELNESIKFLTKKHFIDHLRNESLDGILSFLIHNVIDSFHHKLIDFDTEDWIIPETPKLIKMIYGDRIKNHQNYNKWLRFIRNK